MLNAIKDHEALRKPETSGSFNTGAFIAACDERAKAQWSKSYNEGKVVMIYLTLTNPVSEGERIVFDDNRAPMGNREAIERVAEAFGFPSFGACYQFLKRAKVSGLPSTWPK